MDWTLVGTVSALVVSLLVAFLQKKGKTAAAAQAEEVGGILRTVIHGIEEGTRQNPQLKNIKGYIATAAADAGVQEVLHGLVKKYT